MKIGISGNNRKIRVKMLTFANLFRECQKEVHGACGYIVQQMYIEYSCTEEREVLTVVNL